MPVKATGDGDAGDAQALPGYISIYLQVTDPKNATGKWDCFASYRLCVSNQGDSSKDIARDSWHRYTPHPCTRPTPVHAPPLLPNPHWVGDGARCWGRGRRKCTAMQLQHRIHVLMIVMKIIDVHLLSKDRGKFGCV
jgi:hypothetical protein